MRVKKFQIGIGIGIETGIMVASVQGSGAKNECLASISLIKNELTACWYQGCCFGVFPGPEISLLILYKNMPPRMKYISMNASSPKYPRLL